MKISVIVSAHNCEGTIRKCLVSLLSQTIWRKYDSEIIVVANGCTDGTEAIVRRFVYNNKIKLLSFPKSMGFAGAMNEGYANSTGEIIFPAMGSAYYAEDYMDLCVCHLFDPSVGSVYGFDLQWVDGSRLSTFLDEERRLIKIKYKPFSGWFFRRADLQKLGLETEMYDTKIIGSDVRLPDQIKSLGYKLVWESRAKYWHQRGDNSFRGVFMKGFNMGSKLFDQLWDSGKLTFKNAYWFSRMFYFRIVLVLTYLSFLVGYAVLETMLGIPFYLLGLCAILVLPYVGFEVLALYNLHQKEQRVSSFRNYVKLLPMVQMIRYFAMTLGFVHAIFVRRRAIPY